MSVERKKFHRYILLPDTLYIFVPNSIIPWEVMDIGKGGLSFQYTPIPGEIVASERIDIVCSGCDQYDLYDLSGITCSVVYDNLVLSEGGRFTGKEKRRRGLKFAELTEMQTNSLDSLLDNRSVMLASELRALTNRVGEVEVRKKGCAFVGKNKEIVPGFNPLKQSMAN